MARRSERAHDPVRRGVANPHRSSRFIVHAPHADAVCLAGTFNAWDPASLPMARGITCDWTIERELPPGRHEYKIVVGGRWCRAPGGPGCESAAVTTVLNAFGTANHLREV